MKKEISVCMTSKLRSVELTMPEEVVGDFIVQFGTKFGRQDMGRGFTEAKVDDYFYHPGGWHVSVSVEEKRVEELKIFIAEFGKKYELPVDSSDLVR
jgi:hypothetical protein